MHERMFPILGEDAKLLKGVPWWLVAAHEKQALENHDQTVERLAQRCGLSLDEMAAVLEDRPWRPMKLGDALATVKRIMLETRND